MNARVSTMVVWLCLAVTLGSSSVNAQLVVIDFDGSMGGKDYDLGWIDTQSDSTGEWLTRVLDEGAYDVIIDPADPNNKLFQIGFQDPAIAQELPWAQYTVNDDSLLKQDVYLQLDIMFPDDSLFIAQGVTLAGSFAEPLVGMFRENQALVVNDSYTDVFNARDAGTFGHDVEVIPEQNVWYRYNVKANIPSKSYDFSVTNLFTGEVFQVASGYAFRGDRDLAPDEGLGIIAIWNNNSADWYGRTFIDNIILSNEPISATVEDWSLR